MATFKFKPVRDPDRTVISKKAMYRICESKDRMIMHCKSDIKALLDLLEQQDKEIVHLKHDRKKYLILSVVSTMFGVAGFLAGYIG